jgi:OmpR-family two-component system manganese-sensing response regulator
MAKILIVEDDRGLATMLSDWLQSEKYTVALAERGDDAESLVKHDRFDLIILDWNLPGTSGINVLKQLRQRDEYVPVLMLTSRNELEAKKEGLDSGADDYLTKPFEPVELSARIRALLRRAEKRQSNALTAGPFLLDPERQVASKDGKELKLMPKEFSLLEFFMRHRGEVFTSEALLNRVWSSEDDTSPETIRVHICTLRRKIDYPGKPSFISTVHRAGYRFTCN